jgi:RNA polymerase sigma factor (sigma-70 family)
VEEGENDGAGERALATAPLSKVLAHLRGVLARREAGDQGDGRLLELFLTRRDESAFELLLHRHGPMVLGVCRRVLGDGPDAEDAFQATFLVLVRSGHRVRPRDQVGNWLYGVAYRTALEARRAAARRRLKESRVMPRAQAAEDVWTELWPVLDVELSRLPERYRAPLVLCDVEGITRKEAARQLGWPEGTVSSRLSRAREILSRRLTRHGLALSAGILAGFLEQGTATAVVPSPLVGSTVKAAVLTAAGQTAAAHFVAANAVGLMQRVVRAMRIARFQFLAVASVGIGLVGAATYRGLAEQPAKVVPSPAAEKPPKALVKVVEPEGSNKGEDEEKKPAVSVKDMPPVVVQTSPRAGDTEVNAENVREIRVTFSKDMKDKTWSWSQISDETFPKVNGEVRYDKDRRTCILPVKLQAGKTYAIWVNSGKFGNFKDTDDHPAVPYLLVFETKAAK